MKYMEKSGCAGLCVFVAMIESVVHTEYTKYQVCALNITFNRNEIRLKT